MYYTEELMLQKLNGESPTAPYSSINYHTDSQREYGEKSIELNDVHVDVI
jgi:hypothetical protein